MDLRLLVEERNANIGTLLDVLNFSHFNVFFLFFFVNQPTVHSGGVSRGKVCGCGCRR